MTQGPEASPRPVVPDSWDYGRLSRVATAWPSNVDKHSVDGQPTVRLCNYTDVYKNDSISPQLNFMRATATPAQVERFRLLPGDTVITKDSETADDVGIPAFVEADDPKLICGYHLAIVRPDTRKSDPRFLYWVLSSKPVMAQWQLAASGVTRVGIRSSELTKLRIPLPPRQVQTAIADYLDRETARIDALIEKQGELAALLEERNKAGVAHAVTKGLNQRASTTETRLEWLGPVPSHWEVVRFGHIFRESKETNGAQPVGPMLSVSSLRGIEVKEYEAESQIRTDEMLEDYRVVRPGQLVVNTMWLNHAGLGISELTGHVSPAYRSYSPIRKFHPPYIHHLLRSSSYVSGYSSCLRGIRPNSLQMDRDTLMKWPILLPPLEEQRTIAAFVEQETSKMNSLAAKARSFIEIARERRSALITAAVTGQIDVQETING